MGLMAFGLAACDDDNLPNPPGQSNEQDPVLSSVSVSGRLTQSQYDLESLNASRTNIAIASVSAPDLAEGYSLKAAVEISNDGFANAVSVSSTVNEEDGNYVVSVNPDVLQGAIVSGISKTGVPLNLDVRLQLMTVKNNQTAYIGDPETNYYGPYAMYVIPYPVSLVIEENYYLIGSMTDPAWSLGAGIKFNHVGDDQYANPIFTLEVEITESQASSLSGDGWWWKIIPESTFTSEDWGDTVIGVSVDGSTDIDGKLVDSDAGSGRMAEAGTYLLTINMEEMIYNFSPITDYIWMPGNANGWSFTTKLPIADSANDIYAGYAAVDGGFKFTIEPDWDGPNYGAGASAGTLDTAGDNIELAAKGLYYFDVNMPALSYTSTLIEAVGVIGDATPGGWDNDTPLTQGADFTTWSGIINFTAGEFKFRMNNNWDLNLGGYELDLVQNGSNIASPGSGRYQVILDLGSVPYKCRLIAQ